MGVSPLKWDLSSPKLEFLPLGVTTVSPLGNCHSLSRVCHLSDRNCDPLCLHKASTMSPSSLMSSNGLCHVPRSTLSPCCLFQIPSGSGDTFSPLSPCGNHHVPKKPFVDLLVPAQMGIVAEALSTFQAFTVPFPRVYPKVGDEVEALT